MLRHLSLYMHNATVPRKKRKKFFKSIFNSNMCSQFSNNKFPTKLLLWHWLKTACDDTAACNWHEEMSSEWVSEPSALTRRDTQPARNCSNTETMKHHVVASAAGGCNTKPVYVDRNCRFCQIIAPAAMTNAIHIHRNLKHNNNQVT